MLLPHNGAHMKTAKVIGRSKDIDGFKIGTYDPNPYLDTRVYDVMFSYASVEQYAANVLADNLLSQVDDEGHPHIHFEKIIGHRVDGSESLPTQHNNIHKWIRNDKNVKSFLTVRKGGPQRDRITRRQTYNSVNGKLIEDIMITSKTSDSFLHRPLPPGISDIKMVLYHYSKPTTRSHQLKILWKGGTQE